MGSSPSKNKPGGRPTGRNRRPPAKKPQQRPNPKDKRKDASNEPHPDYIGPNDYYTLEMKNGYTYDARDGFLDEAFYPTSDPFPGEPARQPPSYDRSVAEVEPSNQNRHFPQLRPAREVADPPQYYRQPWEPTDSYAPPRPLRKIEAKEGHVTDDVIAVQEEAEAKSIATQTEPVNSYQSRRPEMRAVRNFSHVQPVQQRIPLHLPAYGNHHGGYRSQSQVYQVPRDRSYPARHTSLSTYGPVRGGNRHNHTAVPSLIPHRREFVVPPPAPVTTPRETVIPPGMAVARELHMSPQNMDMPQPDLDLPPRRVEAPPRENAIAQRELMLPPESDANLRFYRNEIRFRPDGVFIDDIHKHWYGDYDKLENDHTYIQWLFPLAEGSGINPEAQPLKEHEIAEMKRDSRINRRLLKSYMLMLDFYGIAMSNRELGKLQRAETYKSRFVNLNMSKHDYHRISRIIKSMGLLGLQHYQLPLVMFLLNEVLVTRLLSNVKDSNLEKWIEAINDNRERESALTFYIDHVTPHLKNNEGTLSQLASYPVFNDSRLGESIQFSVRRDFEDVYDEGVMLKNKSAKSERLTEIPPLSLGLSRGSP